MNKSGRKNAVFFGVVFLIIFAYRQAFDLVLPVTLKSRFGITEGALYNVIVYMDNLFSLLLFPIFGLLSDKIRSERGKRTPLIIVGVIICALATIALSYTVHWQERVVEANPDKTMIALFYENPVVLIFFAGLLIISLISLAFVTVPAYALLIDNVHKEDSTVVNSIMNFMGGLGSFTAIAIGSLMIRYRAPEDANICLYLIIIGVCALLILVAFGTLYSEPSSIDKDAEVREKLGFPPLEIKTESPQMSVSDKKVLWAVLSAICVWNCAYTFLIQNLSSYSIMAYQNGSRWLFEVTIGCALLSFIPIGLFAKKHGKISVAMSGFLLEMLICGIFPLFAMEDNMIALYSIFILMGTGWGLVNINLFPIIMDYTNGKNNGLLASFYYFSFALGHNLAKYHTWLASPDINGNKMCIFSAMFMAVGCACMLIIRKNAPKDMK